MTDNDDGILQVTEASGSQGRLVTGFQSRRLANLDLLLPVLDQSIRSLFGTTERAVPDNAGLHGLISPQLPAKSPNLGKSFSTQRSAGIILTIMGVGMPN